MSAPVRNVIVGVGVVAVVLVALSTARDERDGREVERARAEMLAGCASAAGPEGHSYCACVVDEVFKRAGTDREQLEALEAEMRVADQGGRTPAVLDASVAACVPS